MDRLIHKPCTCPPNLSWGIYESPRGLKDNEKYLFKPVAYQVKPGNAIVPPPFEPATTFPFERLYPELRTIIYEMHFFQAKQPGTRGEFCPAEDWCPNRKYNSLVPVRKLLLVSKMIYREAMPIFYRKPLRFDSLENLSNFLDTIGPVQRACLQNIAFEWTGWEASKAFARLGMCQGLKNLLITIKKPEVEGERIDAMNMQGVQRLLSSVRGLHGVHVDIQQCHWGLPTKSFVKALEILKHPRESVVEEQGGSVDGGEEGSDMGSRIAGCEDDMGPTKFTLPPQVLPNSEER